MNYNMLRRRRNDWTLHAVSACALILVLLMTGLACCAAPCESSLLQTAPDGPLIQLAWIAGLWSSEADGRIIEEYWMLPRGRLMLGLNRNIAGNDNAFFEYLRIEHTPEGIFYQASPLGRRATPFRLIEAGEAHAVFENPEHDFPQRILYWLEGENTLHTRIEGFEGGVEKMSDWIYQRVY